MVVAATAARVALNTATRGWGGKEVGIGEVSGGRGDLRAHLAHQARGDTVEHGIAPQAAEPSAPMKRVSVDCLRSALVLDRGADRLASTKEDAAVALAPPAPKARDEGTRFRSAG